jgi:hypothetical protein
VALATRETEAGHSALYDLDTAFSPFGSAAQAESMDARATVCLPGQLLLRGALALSASAARVLASEQHLFEVRPWFGAGDLTRRGLGEARHERSREPEDQASDELGSEPSPAPDESEPASDPGDDDLT